MEDKITKVRCIDARDNEKLEENKIYIVKKEFDKSYSLEGMPQDYQFHKTRFEKVENALMVKCIDNKGYEECLILNKIYKVLEEDEENYFVRDELFKNKTGFLKSRFKSAELLKEKTYSFEEVSQKIKEGETFNSVYSKWVIKSIRKENGVLRYMYEGKEKERFVRVEKSSKQLEHTEEKENKCYNKECQHNAENKCSIFNGYLACGVRIKEPINFEEEYYKLKEETEEQKATVEMLLKGNQHLEMEMSNRIKERDNYKEISESQNKRITELERDMWGLEDKLTTIDDEHQVEIEQLKGTFQTERNALNSEIYELNQRIKILETTIEENKEDLEKYKMLKKIVINFVEGL